MSSSYVKLRDIGLEENDYSVPLCEGLKSQLHEGRVEAPTHVTCTLGRDQFVRAPGCARLRYMYR